MALDLALGTKEKWTLEIRANLPGNHLSSGRQNASHASQS